MMRSRKDIPGIESGQVNYPLVTPRFKKLNGVVGKVLMAWEPLPIPSRGSRIGGKFSLACSGRYAGAEGWTFSTK
jgi:hypothetical protein